MKRQNAGADSEQNDGVYGVRRELLPHEKEREERGEAELRCDDEGGSGDRKPRHAVGVKVVVEAGEDSDEGGGGEERGLHRD